MNEEIKKIKQVIEKNKQVKIEDNIQEKEFIDKYFENYNDQWNIDWEERWYDVETRYNEYDLLMAIYQIDEWAFQYKKDIYFFEIDREDNYITNINGKKIKEKNFIKYIGKLNIGGKNILDVLDGILEEEEIYDSGI